MKRPNHKSEISAGVLSKDLPEPEWFRSWFDSPYYYLLYRDRDEREAERLSLDLIHQLKIVPPNRILDVGCGRGRHGRALAQAGFEVTGIDLSAHAISIARQYETDRLHFFQHDMREPAWINYFDEVFSFFTSFGFFEKEREHQAALRSMTQALRPGGRLFLDYLNVHYVEQHLVPMADQHVEGVHFHLTKWMDPGYLYKKIEISDGPCHFIYTERLARFGLKQFEDLFGPQGLVLQDVFGDYDFSPFDQENSPRLMMVATKMR